MNSAGGQSHDFSGGCLCGGVRFQFNTEPVVAGFCHCGLCRKAKGAPVAAIAVFPKSAFRLLQGETATHPSSARGLRHFCADCGSPLFFEPLDKPDLFEAYAGVFDDPDMITPSLHIWTSSALPWLHINDQLVRFPENRPSGYGERTS